MGLAAMINTLIAACDVAQPPLTDGELESLLVGDQRALARALTTAETDGLSEDATDVAVAVGLTVAVPVAVLSLVFGSGESLAHLLVAERATRGRRSSPPPVPDLTAEVEGRSGGSCAREGSQYRKRHQTREPALALRRARGRGF